MSEILHEDPGVIDACIAAARRLHHQLHGLEAAIDLRQGAGNELAVLRIFRRDDGREHKLPELGAHRQRVFMRETRDLQRLAFLSDTAVAINCTSMPLGRGA